MKIAVIGSGISGLGAAYILSHAHDVTVYEKNPVIGGHSRTIDIPDTSGPVPVDTGFIVYNEINYPLLTGLFRHLDVPVIKSDMSFGVSIADGWLEYSSKSVFPQTPQMLLTPAFWGMLRDILIFNAQAEKWIEAPDDKTLGQCLDDMKMGDWFRQYYLQAMGAAIWSCPVETIVQYPAKTFIRFFKNHGLLTVNAHPQWYTVKGGSREYVRRLTAPFKHNIRVNCGAAKIIREAGRVVVHDTKGTQEIFDHVILAGHADQSLALLDNPSAAERDILGAFTFQENRVVVHSDESFMPKRKKCWASWVYLSSDRQDNRGSLALTYWMNNLQKMQTEKPLLVTLNPGRSPRADVTYDTHTFSHPVFTTRTLAAQNRMQDIQGAGNVWYAGAWQRYGFHEDGLMSAVNVCAKLGAGVPWK